MNSNIGIRNTLEGGRSLLLILRRILEVNKKGCLVALPPAVGDGAETSFPLGVSANFLTIAVEKINNIASDHE